MKKRPGRDDSCSHRWDYVNRIDATVSLMAPSNASEDIKRKYEPRSDCLWDTHRLLVVW